MIGVPQHGEAALHYFTYIDLIPHEDILEVLESQLAEIPALAAIPEEKSLHRYAPGKWSMRELLNHVTDQERVFVYRALWFARCFQDPLPGFDENTSAAAACSDLNSWASHVEEFRTVRESTLSFFRNLPPEAWMRTGTAAGKIFSVRALAYIAAGHFKHHLAILHERYLSSASA